MKTRMRRFPSNVVSKYRNIKIEIDGIVFDSKLEANYYCYLKLLKKSRVIKDFELQPKFQLQPSFKYRGKTIREISYIGDFLITFPDGHKECHDTKAIETEVFQIKKKLFVYHYPDIPLVIVKKGDF